MRHNEPDSFHFPRWAIGSWWYTRHRCKAVEFTADDEIVRTSPSIMQKNPHTAAMIKAPPSLYGTPFEGQEVENFRLNVFYVIVDETDSRKLYKTEFNASCRFNGMELFFGDKYELIIEGDNITINGKAVTREA